VIAGGLEMPTSLALDPEIGQMFWTDAGTVPRIESSWMDGSHRKIIIGDKLEIPSGIVVDYSANHRIYWCDSKANSIESARPDGSDRRIVLKGELFHPVSIDVFEDQLYWVTRDTGEVYRQDKFGRGVKVRVKRSLEHATDVKIFHKMKYNMSRKLRHE
jgi:low density lipoprotein-related protein 2